jgi:histidyl-tRNA synthetase
LDKLRREHISCDIDYEQSSLKSQLRSANKAGAKFVIIIGEEEVRTDTVSLKEMSSGKQEKISSDQITKELKKRL